MYVFRRKQQKMTTVQSTRWRWLITFILASMAASLMYQAAWERRRTSYTNNLTIKKSRTTTLLSSKVPTIATIEGQHALQHNDMGFCPITINSGESSNDSSNTVLTTSSSNTGLRRTPTNPTILHHKSSKEELSSPLCKELATRIYENNTLQLKKGYWTAKVCRFFVRNIKKQVNNGIPISNTKISICNYMIDYSQYTYYCGQMIAEKDAPEERIIHPYTREVPQTFYFWNKALAAYCDVSPKRMVDDSWDLPVDDYTPYVKTAKTFYVVSNQVCI